AVGLDALSFGIDPDTGQSSLAVGKYVADDIYVSARQALGQTGTEVSVTYELNDKINIESTLKPDGAQSVSANYKRNY
ncbi:MAG: translocation/assembly module TamB domain-containing protein, partial [Pseudomonadota bacterium]